MSYYIGTREECDNYNQQVKEEKGLIEDIIWANPIKHPTEDKYAIHVCPAIESELEQVDMLDETWTYNEEL